MECNQGTFLLKIDKDGKAEATKVNKPCSDKINIQSMTTMLLGYKRPSYLAKIGRIEASKETINMLETSIIHETPYISDYF